jgi:hypothetical protein
MKGKLKTLPKVSSEAPKLCQIFYISRIEIEKLMFIK